MTKKRLFKVRRVYMGWFLARMSSILVLVPLSLLLFCTACGNSNSSSTSSPAFHTTLQMTDKTFIVQVTITPNQVGNNTFTVTFLSPQRRSSQNVQVDLQTTMLDMAMGTESVPLQADYQGSYSGQGTLTMSGHWQIRVVLHTPDHRLHEGQFQATLA
jgi:hypothetical protein